MAAPTILALDFDGVLCDGLVEYFQTAWRAYCQVFQPADDTPPPGLAARFYPLRPVIETGWEMPLLLHGLLHGVEDTAVLSGWAGMVPDLLANTGLEPSRLMAAVDDVRDRWIQTDLEGWLSQHRFYSGTVAWVQRAMAAGIYPVIISTKEGRFIAQLLQGEGIDLSPEQILGKEVKRPKAETLSQLLHHPPANASAPPQIWFMEDRYKTLEKVMAQPSLDSVTLFLADWGYNTVAERAAAEKCDRIHLRSLAQIGEENFSTPRGGHRP
ncbi:HAD family hydrolase [Leptolyngbya sp. PCC 6406]|uniref:HAD family hydrolase n=1 Tax=Leptolyngbya sp. PCC 6406 TaxID=1173264 RepID=UPI0002ABB718|nr:hypothetical protein [Leptolyngbya sp. PCC 6406]